MWSVLETKQVQKQLAKAPNEICEKYEFWKSVVRTSGPDALRAFPGMNDEALSGAWAGYRSSRLNKQWRVIYRIERSEATVCVVRVSPHDYR